MSQKYEGLPCHTHLRIRAEVEQWILSCGCSLFNLMSLTSSGSEELEEDSRNSTQNHHRTKLFVRDAAQITFCFGMLTETLIPQKTVNNCKTKAGFTPQKWSTLGRI